MIRKRADGVYQVIVYLGADPETGKERRARRTVHGFRNAQAVERALKTEGAPVHLAAQSSLGELIDRWLDLAERDLSPTTVRGYRASVKRYLPPDLGKGRIDQLHPERLDRLYTDLLDQGLAPATVRQVHSVIRRACAQAVRWGWLPTNPAARATPPMARRTTIRPPSPADITRLLTVAEQDPEFGLLVWLAIITGARRGELCALRWTDIHGTRLTIARTIIELGSRTAEKPTKTGRTRSVALDKSTVRRLAKWQAVSTERAAKAGVGLNAFPYVFSRPDGQAWHPGSVTQRWRRLAARLKIECRFHDLRHWNVTHMLDGGTRAGLVANRVGHQSTKMTLDVYGHPVDTDEQAAAERIARLARG